MHEDFVQTFQGVQLETFEGGILIGRVEASVGVFGDEKAQVLPTTSQIIQLFRDAWKQEAVVQNGK
jgi:hypothetical protein